MLDTLAFVGLFPLSLAALALAYFITVRREPKDRDEAGEAAFGLGQAAIFGLIALILGFSFAFATDRFEARRALVVNEAVAVGRVALHADFLPPAQRTPFRRALAAYAQNRLAIYAVVSDESSEDKLDARGEVLFDRVWSVASAAAAHDPHDLLTADLAMAVDEMGDIAEEQEAALNNHVPNPIIGIVLFSTLAGAVLLGLTFGRAKSPNIVLSTVFCLLCAATVFTIVDLDDGKRGFIRLETAPLQSTLNDITGSGTPLKP